MKRAILFCLVVGFSLSAFAATDVTVDQLNKQIMASKGKDDVRIAALLTSLHLTERLRVDDARSDPERESSLAGASGILGDFCGVTAVRLSSVSKTNRTRNRYV